MARTRSRKSSVTIVGSWLPLPLDFLRSRAFAQLSLHAAKMLFDLCAQLGANARGNGDLSAANSVMGPRGWTSTATRLSALEELTAAGLLVMTRRGDRRRPHLYAITLWPLDCDLSKLDVRPGCYSCADWRVAEAAADTPPTAQTPVRTRQIRAENKASGPVAGGPPIVMFPQRENRKSEAVAFAPATGT